jgi:hypothetical protein
MAKFAKMSKNRGVKSAAEKTRLADGLEPAHLGFLTFAESHHYIAAGD